MTGHAFQVLLNDADALAVFKTARGHLKDRGRFAFETRNPTIDWAAEWSERPPRRLSGGTIIEALEITSAKGEFVSFRTSYRFPHENLTIHSTLRFPSRKHVESLVARSGLAVQEVFGDWDGSSFEQAARAKSSLLRRSPIRHFPNKGVRGSIEVASETYADRDVSAKAAQI